MPGGADADDATGGRPGSRPRVLTMADVRIALAQIDTCVGDLEGNTRAVLTWTRKAAEAGADVVAFPEMCLTGYPIEDLALRASFRRGAERALAETAAQLAAEGLGDLTVVVGSVGERTTREHDGAPARPTNQAVVLRGGAVVARYDKHHLPNYGVFDEFRIFAPGTEPCVIDVRGRRLGIVVCEDIWQDGGPVAQMDAFDVDLLLVLNGSPFEEGKGHVRGDLAARRAREVDAPVAYVNMVGGQDDLVFDGGSFVVGADGELLARSPQFVEDLLLWDLPGAGDGPAEGTVKVTAEGTAEGTAADGPASTVDRAPLPRRVAPPLDPDEEIYRALETGLAGYARKNGFRSVVLGMSGGIDSALVAAVAADALGGDRVVGVSMPSRHSSGHSRDDAADLAERIGADYRVQPIGPMVDAFEGEMTLEGLAAENLQARVRGVVLMALSNAEGHLVLATGNKTELAVGYSTIYGDAVGGYAPLKDVDKSRVWALARWRNNHAVDHGEIPPIPESSITKPPSAELRPGQVDQDSLPPYDLLDEVLDAYVENAEGRGRAARPRVRPRGRRQGAQPRGPGRVEAAAVPAGSQGHRAGVRPRPPPAHHQPLARAGRPRTPRARAGAALMSQTPEPADRRHRHRRRAPRERRPGPRRPASAPRGCGCTTCARPRSAASGSRCSPPTTTRRPGSSTRPASTCCSSATPSGTRCTATTRPSRSRSTRSSPRSGPSRRRRAARSSSPTCRSGPTRPRAEQAFTTAVRMLKEGGAHAVKFEGGRRVAAQVRMLTDAGIPVVGHLGFTPQSENLLGGKRVQGRGEEAAERLSARTPSPCRRPARSPSCSRWCPRRSPRGSPRCCASRPSASARARRATGRCSSGWTWPAWATGRRGSPSSSPRSAARWATPRAPTPPRSGPARSPTRRTRSCSSGADSGR